MSEVELHCLEDVTGDTWRALSRRRIFFAHQSVGGNILDGMRDIVREYGNIDLRVAKIGGSEEPAAAALLHAPVGRNGDPRSKLDGFRDALDAGLGEGLDVAGVKLCFVDVTRDTDVGAVFDDYRQVLGDLEERYPRIAFIHFSVPICSRPVGLKKQLKSFINSRLGKPGVWEDNFKRQQYNQLLARAYGESDRFLDVALLESLTLHAERRREEQFVLKGGAKVRFMAPENTDDGGHLSKIGRQIIAEQFLILLARLADKQD